jgi:ubiquinone/menaquinone biosynthesis C-methylase UbiE
MTEINYNSTAAGGYDQGFGRVSTHFIPYLLQAGHVATGQRVLDIATGTGLIAHAALAAVGPGGHVTAADLSADMVDQARRRLGEAPNVALGIEDGQALSFPDDSFDAVLCSLGLMFFPSPASGLREFRRVLRRGGRAALSVNTVPERSYNTRIHVIIARHAPSLAPVAARVFSLGDEVRLRGLFEDAGFENIEILAHSHRFPVDSFDAYFEHIERGWGSAGEVFVSNRPSQGRAGSRFCCLRQGPPPTVGNTNLAEIEGNRPFGPPGRHGNLRAAEAHAQQEMGATIRCRP